MINDLDQIILSSNGEEIKKEFIQLFKNLYNKFIANNYSIALNDIENDACNFLDVCRKKCLEAINYF